MKMKKWFYISCLLLISLPAYANNLTAFAGNGIFDEILKRFSDTASQWGSIMISSASWLFGTLSLLSMIWTYSLLALKRADIQEFISETVKFFITTGFFLWLLTNGPAISMAIINSLREIAAKASGLPNSLSPSGIVDVGFKIVQKVIHQSSAWSPVISAIGIIIGIVVLVVIAWIATEILVLLISSWLLAYAGVFLLGFGGGRWTTDIAINYYRTVLGIGVQIFSMILLIGIGRSFIDQYYAAIGSNISLMPLIVLLVASLILLKLVNKIPPLLGGIVSGSNLSGGGTSFSAGGMLGGASMALAGAQVAGSAMTSGITHMAGGASALHSAFKAAQHNMSEGTGKFSGSSATSVGGLSAAMGNAGRFMADMSSNFARGLGDVAKEKAGGIMDSAKENISQTMGGKVASSIQNNISPGKDSSSSQSQFNGDGLGAGNNKNQSNGANNGKNEEVVSFVNKRRK